LALLDEVHEPDVGAVEKDRRRDVRDLDLLAVEGHVHHAISRDRALVGHLHLFVGGHAARRTRAPRRHVDLAALRAALAPDLALLDPPQEPGRGPPRVVLVAQVHRRADALDGLGRFGLRLAHASSSGTKQTMSWISPTRSSRHLAFTRMPVRTPSSAPASTAWSRAVSPPAR